MVAMIYMKSSISILLALIFILTITQSNSENTLLSSSIHELLKSQGLPGGLFPTNVKAYTLNNNGVLEVYFDEPCVAKFETLVRFEKVVRANLTYGGLNGVVGLTQEELFLWLPVVDIVVQDPSSGIIMFNMGVAEKQLAFSIFEVSPICRPPNACEGQRTCGFANLMVDIFESYKFLILPYLFIIKFCICYGHKVMDGYGTGFIGRRVWDG